MSEHPDLLVIGTGAAGIEAALTARQDRVQVVVVGSGELGGTCVNAGCVPSNALLHAAEIHRDGSLGTQFDLAAAHRAAGKVSTVVRESVRRRLSAAGVRIIEGRASLGDDGSTSIVTTEGELVMRPAQTIIATGATTVLPRVAHLDHRRVLTSADALALQEIPRSAIVVLGGHLGLEWATFLRDAGTQVTVIEEFATLRSVPDAEVADYLSGLLEASGITIQTHARIMSVEPSDDAVTITTDGPSGDLALTADVALFADFRHPNSAGLGLDKLGIELDPDGAIVVDDRLRTGVADIWAAGDVTGGLMLAAEARAEGAVAARNACGHESINDRRVIPRAVHTGPEAASVGMTEAQARESGANVAVGYAEYAGSARALILGADQGVVKLVSDAGTEEILGVSIVGRSAIELASLVALAMQAELTVSELARSNHAHPAIVELIVDASRAALVAAR